MTIREKLALMQEISRRNNAYVRAYLAARDPQEARACMALIREETEAVAGEHGMTGEELMNSLLAAPEEEDAQ